MEQTLEPNDSHIRPDDVDDATVEAVGKLTEAFECLAQSMDFSNS